MISGNSFVLCFAGFSAVKMKIATIIGARPQFIKASPVSRALANCAEIEEVLVHTGQHSDDSMSDVFFREMEIPAPRYHLGIAGLAHGAMTGRMLEAIEQILVTEKPDWALVYGDTNSTLAGALAACKMNIPVAHVEAGLRSFNRRMPEEINRICADHISAALFAPTRTAVRNLANEGVARDKVLLTGDVMYDATIAFSRLAEDRSRILADLDLNPGAYVLATIHRAENTDNPARLTAILQGLGQASHQFPVVLPLHPRTRNAVAMLGHSFPKTVTVANPVGYLDMLMLEKNARLIATDSGGVQKEAYFHRVPCVTLRDETEWVELVEAGANRLAPPHDSRTIADAIESALAAPRNVFGQSDLYGNGNAAEKIAAWFCRAH